MSRNLTRRGFLASTAALGAASMLTSPLAHAAAAPRRLVVDRRTIEVNGKSASVFGIQSPNGRPGLFLEPGERFALNLENRCGEPTIVHWHGQTPPPADDGVVHTDYVAAIADGESRSYDFPARPGTHWMHSHHGLQEQGLMAGPLVVRTSADLAADMQEATVLLHDFSFTDPAELLASVAGASGGMAMHDMGTMGGGMMGGGMMHGMGGMMDLNDIDYDAYLANDRTLDDPEVVRTERGGRVRLRLINGASSTAFWIDLGGNTATVLAVDGNPVIPVTGSRFPMAMAQRLDLLVDVPAGEAIPVLAQREGDRARTGIVLAAPGAKVTRLAAEAGTAAPPVDLELEGRLSAEEPLPARDADAGHGVMLSGSMAPYLWGIDGRTWQEHRPIRVASGQRVLLDLQNHSMMMHPMHLHGHHFQVVALNGRPIAGAIRDTVLVPPMNRVTIAFEADNPGRWLFHCHNLYHMATGMMTRVVYNGEA